MTARNTRPAPSPSIAGFPLSRRSVVKGALGAAALGLGVPLGRASAQINTMNAASGELTVGSNYTDTEPTKQGLHAVIDAFPNNNVTIKLNEVDHNTFQENITTYLQNPDDVIPWFAGFRMRYFAAQGLVGAIDDVWAADLNSVMSAGFKQASTGDDGKLYFVPWTYYCWGIHYRPSVFQENEWTPPTTYDELKTLATAMQDKGMIPFAFGNDGRWPAMGTFDQLNFRINGYQFHMDLMAGKESWTDDRVKNVFAEWTNLLPFQQENPNGRKWQEAAAGLVDKTAGMMTIGNFVGEAFPEADRSDLDFFPWPSMNDEFGTDTIEAPIDGWMMAAKPKNPDAAKELLYFFGTADAQETYLKVNPSVIGAASDIDKSIFTPLQQKVLEAVSAAPHVTQFLDRDTSPEFAANVAGQAFADFLAEPDSIDSILEDMQAQAEVIFAQ